MNDQPPDETTRRTAPAGWYPHPSMADTQRYWNGSAWTDHIAPLTRPAPSPAQHPTARDNEALITWGYVTAILFPIVGFIIGVVLLGRRPGHGVLCMLIAIAAAMAWYALLTPDPQPAYDYGSGY